MNKDFVKFRQFQDELHNLLLTHTDKNGIMNTLLDHFTFIEMLSDGSQGRVGILKHKKSERKIIFKISKDIDYNIRHEYSIMERIKGSRKYCPHFCEVIGSVKSPISFHGENPFSELDAKVCVDILLTEYIPGSLTLTKYVHKLPPKNLYSIIRQVLLASEIGKRKFKLVHYDLHTDNILPTKCDPNTFFLYNFGDRQLLVPTYGFIPTIIDFGFAYTGGIANQPLYSTMSSTDAGYLSCLYDPYYDARIFLLNISTDMESKGPLFRKKVLGLYNHLNVDQTCGWDIQEGQYSTSEVIEFTIIEVEEKTEISTLFRKYASKCVRIIQSLINLPLVNRKNGNFIPYYTEFVSEFCKFEKSVRTHTSKLILLSNLVDAARISREMFLTGDKNEAVKVFRHHFLSNTDLSLKFYIPPPDVNYPRLMENLYLMTECIGTVYYRVMNDILKTKKKQYAGDCHDTFKIYDMIDSFFSTPYKITSESKVYVWDIVNETSSYHSDFSEEFCDRINALPSPKKVTLMWDTLLANLYEDYH